MWLYLLYVVLVCVMRLMQYKLFLSAGIRPTCRHWWSICLIWFLSCSCLTLTCLFFPYFLLLLFLSDFYSLHVSFFTSHALSVSLWCNKSIPLYHFPFHFNMILSTLHLCVPATSMSTFPSWRLIILPISTSSSLFLFSYSQNYFKDAWNIFDCVTVLGSVTDILVTELGVSRRIEFSD